MRKKICFVVAVPGTANSFLRDHIKALRTKYDVYLAGNIKSEKEIERLDVSGFHTIDIQRNISLKKDVRSVLALKKYFAEMGFDAVHSVTPKAGLVTAFSARLAGIKTRIHIFTGQVWATKKGFMKAFLKTTDRFIAMLDNHILVDGQAQMEFLEKNGIFSHGRAKVLGAGSISGVNTVRFTPSDKTRKEVRETIGIGEQKIVFSFMGRQNKDKGINELFEAFNRLAGERRNVFLLLIGTDEEDCQAKLPEYRNIKPGENYCFYGRTSEPEKILQASDVFCMPSYREGFGTSVIEASCLGIPVICSDIYGLRDTMIDRETGLRCKVADAESLYQCMLQLADDPELLRSLGENGRLRVLQNFDGAIITKEWCRFYDSLLSK